MDEDEGGAGRWREYVASYVTKQPTEWIVTSDGKKMSGAEPFLTRYVFWPAAACGDSERYY